ncbi:hypothetical protein C8R43DRAFT_942827 [Mycena crocata]|nr:hypothetical protein C8R43DRAFT_942827 [Mycena crocata]
MSVLGFFVVRVVPSTCVQALLLTNRRPASAEEADLKEHRACLLARLADLEADIAKVSDIAKGLRERETQHSQAIRSVDGALSILRSFPAEILAEIFAQFRNLTRSHDARAVRTGVGLLARVCGRWRAIAVGSPRLWDTLRLMIDRKITEDHEDHIMSLLRRSENLSLRLELQGSHLNMFPSVWDVSSRVAELRLFVSPDFSLRPPRTSFPRLEVAHIDLAEGSDNSEPWILLPGVLTWLRDAPRLHTLSIKTVVAFPKLHTCDVPWAQLTAVQLELPIAVVLAFKVLASCPLLSDCVFSGVVESLGTQAAPSLPALDQLTSFHVDMYVTGADRILDALACPNLTRLELTWLPGPSEAYIAFASRSSFRLKSLTITYLDDGPAAAALLSFLRLQPQLEDLTINAKDPPGWPIFALFSGHAGVDGLRLAHLHTVALVAVASAADGEAVVRMLQQLSPKIRKDGDPFPLLSSVRIEVFGEVFEDSWETELKASVDVVSLVFVDHRSVEGHRHYYDCDRYTSYEWYGEV